MRDNMLPQKDGEDVHAQQVEQFFDSSETVESESFAQERSESSEQSETIVRDRYGEQVFDYEYERSPYLHDQPEDVLVRWQGPEYEVYEKSATWYLVAGLVLVAIILYALFTNSPIMAIVFVLIGVVGYLYIGTPPRVMDFGITYDGIVVGNRIYHFDDIDSFWIFYEPPHTRVISLHMKGRLTPYIHIPLHQLDPVEVRELLMKFILEKKQEHTLVDTLERVLHI